MKNLEAERAKYLLEIISSTSEEADTSDGDEEHRDTKKLTREGRKNRRLDRAQHFIQLFSSLNTAADLFPRMKVFGFFISEHKVYTTFLEIEGVTTAKEVKYFFQLLLNSNIIDRTIILSNTDTQLNFVSLKSYLNLFVPSHFKVLMLYIQYLVLCERRSVFLQDVNLADNN